MNPLRLLSALLPLLFAGILSAKEIVLFNGKDLSGWDGNSTHWSVQNGAIRGEAKADQESPDSSQLTENSFLVWRGDSPANFELRLKFRFLINSGNSGVQFRSRVLRYEDIGPIVAGYQADICISPFFCGILYDERGHGVLAKRGENVIVMPDARRPRVAQSTVISSFGKENELLSDYNPLVWNDYVIKADGNRIELFLNERRTVFVTETRPNAPKSGVIAFQLHHSDPALIEFKDIVLIPRD